jgi:hypothetical protein
VLRVLPVTARISQAWLMTGTPVVGGWRQVGSLPLGLPR